jgi:uncharacterized protein (DUF433 family)
MSKNLIGATGAVRPSSKSAQAPTDRDFAVGIAVVPVATDHGQLTTDQTSLPKWPNPDVPSVYRNRNANCVHVDMFCDEVPIYLLDGSTRANRFDKGAAEKQIVVRSRVLLGLVIRAFQRGQTPEGIVQSFDTLILPDVYAVVSYYLANPAPINAYLATCDQNAEAMREKLEAAGMTGRVGKEELLARARAKGLLGDPPSDR